MATYKIIGKRFLRKYTADVRTPVYAAATDAARIVAEFCNVPWEASPVRRAEMPPHGDEANPANRECFDAALFCAEHSDGLHRACANAAVYRFTLPDAAVGASLSSLSVTVTSDPYNANGARLHVFTSATGEIPTSCRAVRGDGADGEPLADGTTSAGVAPRETRTVSKKDYWHPVTATATLAPTGGLALKKYLFVAVVLESYATTRGNWLEGSSFIDNLVTVETSAAVSGWTDGGTYDLSGGTARSFAVVEGGVMAARPAGDGGVRALTVQRTGDDFARTHAAPEDAAAALYRRAQVAGIRTLDLSGGFSAATFATPFLSGAAKNVSVFPALSPSANRVVNGAVVADADKYTTVTGDFAAGTFPDLQGMFVVSTTTSTGANAKLSSSNTLASAASGDVATNLADLKSMIVADGGIGSAGYLHRTGSSSPVFLCTKKSFPTASAGSYGNPLSATLSGGKVTLVGAPSVTWQNCGGKALIVPAYSYGTTYATNELITYPLCHNATAKTITVFSSTVVPEIAYVGTVTAIRPLFVPRSMAQIAFIVSGDLESVFGVPCRNFALVTISQDGETVSAIVPECDALITPDSYRNFAVSVPVCGGNFVMDEFYVTGGFTTLGGEPCEIAAHVSGTTVTPIALPAGTRPPEYFLFCDAAGATAGKSAFWVDAQPDAADFTTYAAPKAAVTDAQSAFGLRRLYADLYGGALPAATVSATARPGAAFVVRGDEIAVRTGAGDDDVASAKCWNLSASVLVVPFSCPRDFCASRVRLDWPAVAATAGARVNVWLKRGEYLRAYPTSYPKELFTGEARESGGWELVGTVTPANATAGTATLDVDPITDDTATLMFVAFVGQDDFNPSADMALPRGIGALNVNEVTGTQSGLDTGFSPDITLLGEIGK